LTFSIRPLVPYSLALTAARYSRFPDPVDRFDGKRYQRLLAVGRGGVLAIVEQTGGESNPKLRIALEGPGADSPRARSAADRLVKGALGAGADLALFYRAARVDPLLAPLVRRFRGLRIAGYPSLWEALVTAVLSQQVNLSLAFGIRAQLASEFGRKRRIGGETYFAFPMPDAIAAAGERGLQGFRMSAGKIGTVSRLAKGFASGKISEEEIAALPEEAAVERLTEIKGIGRWTAETALLRGLSRADAFPAGDLGIVKYLAEGLFDHGRRATESEMRLYAERWRPWRGLALAYCWAELARRDRKAPVLKSSAPVAQRPPRR
jgi:DNA-3-methyladenine glycosylase II